MYSLRAPVFLLRVAGDWVLLAFDAASTRRKQTRMQTAKEKAIPTPMPAFAATERRWVEGIAVVLGPLVGSTIELDAALVEVGVGPGAALVVIELNKAWSEL